MKNYKMKMLPADGKQI